jgi:hypothetical protein
MKVMKPIWMQSVVVMTVLLFLPASSRTTPTLTQASAPVEVTTPMAPIAVKSSGQTHLVYELHITNFYANTGNLTLRRLEVFGQGDSARPLATYQDKELTDLIVHPGTAVKEADKRVIRGGMRAVVC